MDPDATLTELMDFAADVLAATDTDDGPADWTDTVRVAELLQSLDGWLTTGGFLPRRWAARQRPQ